MGGRSNSMDVLEVITKYQNMRGWSLYQLAQRSGLPQSTISSWYNKGAAPSTVSLQKICDAFGITMSQLFSAGESTVTLTENQRKLLERWGRLNQQQQEFVFQLMEKM